MWKLRFLDKFGWILLSLVVRQALGWGRKAKVELWFNGAGDEVLIWRHNPTCIFCEEQNNLMMFSGRRICPQCRDEISSM